MNPRLGAVRGHCFRSLWWATEVHDAPCIRITHIPECGAWCERITVIAYPLPRIVLCRGVTAIFAQPRFCAPSVRVEWRRRSLPHGENAAKTSGIRPLNGIYYSAAGKMRVAFLQRGLFLSRLTELTATPCNCIDSEIALRRHNTREFAVAKSIVITKRDGNNCKLILAEK